MVGRLAGDDGLCILKGRPGYVAEVGHPGDPTFGRRPSPRGCRLVVDGRKANTIHRQSPGAEVSGLDVPDPRRVSSHRVEVGVAEADGIEVPAIEVLEVEAGIALAEEIAPEPEAGKPVDSGRRSWTILA